MGTRRTMSSRNGSLSRRARRAVSRTLSRAKPSPRRSSRRRTPSRRGRRRGVPATWRRVLKWGAYAVGGGTLMLMAITAWLVFTLPDFEDAVVPDRRPVVMLLAANGAPVHRFGDLQGDRVGLEEMPDHLIQAVLATEDRRFYWHLGIDPIGIARAMVANIRAGRLVQGGSTITQQLAKNLFLTPDRTLRRKAQEALLAMWLELRFSKDEILAAYLNRVYMGAGTYGVDAAAWTYFGVPVTDISLEQSAMLAGLLKAPSRYAPTRSPELAQQRADLVLAAMVEEGYVSADHVERVRDLPPLPRRRPTDGGGGRYFADWVAERMSDFVGFDQGDLVVRTTLDPVLQSSAERIVGNYLEREGGPAGVGQAALVALSPGGEIRAMVGGRSYGTSQFNRAVQALRQPGSAFKPIIYLAGLEQGLRPDMQILDAPIEIAGYAPRNFDDTYRGYVTALDALASSINSASVRVLDQAGVDNAIDVARRLGITAELRRDLTLALGSSEVTLLELTSAYGALLRDGRPLWPYGISAIESIDEGATVYSRQGDGAAEMIRPWHVWELNRMLEHVMLYGTGRGAQLDRPAAGKTGTSQDNRDAWFVGFTADLIVGVWVGNDDGAPMNGVSGSGLPARIWRDFMLSAHRGVPPRPLPGVGPQTPVASAQPSSSGGGIGGFLDRLFGGN